MKRWTSTDTLFLSVFPFSAFFCCVVGRKDLAGPRHRRGAAVGRADSAGSTDAAAACGT